MHITLEMEYALRIVDTLARHTGRIGAKAIAEKACVTLRFSLKILRKLVTSGIICSYKGPAGGYELARSPDEVSLNDVLEAIEGPYMLNRCLREDSPCNRIPDKNCPYHYLFEHISDQVRAQLSAATLASILGEEQAAV